MDESYFESAEELRATHEVAHIEAAAEREFAVYEQENERLRKRLKTLRKEVLQEARLAACSLCRDDWRSRYDLASLNFGKWIHRHVSGSSQLSCDAGAILDLENK